MDKTNALDDWLARKEDLQISPLQAGLEAEALKVSVGDRSFVLKIWNKDSSPDVRYQYVLLQALREKGVSVSEPYGWGYYSHDHKVLATSFDGSPITKVNKQNLPELAKLLAGIHHVPIGQMDRDLHRTFDFIDYFYPTLTEHPDLQERVQALVEKANMEQSHLIHGDFNLGNILVHDGAYTVIDWTNAQLGDPRYDAGWASFLIAIYVREKAGRDFVSSYISDRWISKEDMELFEAIACLRWILLYRIANVPKMKNTVQRVNRFIIQNPYLERDLMV